MEAVNSIIRELWTDTYRGNDINYIKIKTDDTMPKGADQRRVYNYNVSISFKCHEPWNAKCYNEL